MSVLCNHHRPGRHCRSSLMLLCIQPPVPTPVPWQPRVSFLLLPCTFLWRRDLTSLTQHGYLRFIFTVRFYSPLLLPSIPLWASLVAQRRRIHLPCRRAGGMDLIPGSGRSFRGGHGNPLQHSCLEKPMDRGADRL